MWHEARKQEKLIRGLIVDYRRRAERRRDYYEKIKADPTQFLQVHGRQCKIHLDPAVTIAGDSPAIMMPWQGDTNNMIDRFDARAHLDYIVDVKNPEINVDDLEQEERQCNYERYRILAQNTFLGISEQKFLHQLSIEEQFGVTIDEREATKEKNEKKGTGAMIGYNYDDPTAQPPITAEVVNKAVLPQSSKESDDDDESDLEVLDVDLSIDVNKMEPSQAHELNTIGPHYGMAGCDLFSFLTGDADEVEQQRQQMREEKEKAMFSGRKSRRERRAHRDKRQLNRVLSPPSYAAPKEEVTKIRRENSRSLSRSPSPHQEKIEFITSFGGDEEEKSSKSKTYAEKLKTNLKQRLSYSDALKGVSRLPDKARREMGPSFLDSDDKYRKVKDRSRSRIRKSRSRSYSRLHRSRSRSYRSRSCSRSYRSRSRSRRSYRSRSSDSSCSSKSRKRSLSRSRFTKTNNTRNYQRRSRSVGSDNVKQKPIPRYYGRKRDENRSSSELSLDSDSSDTPTTCVTANVKAAGVKLKPNPRVTGSSNKDHSNKGETLTLKERLKRKMQAQLNKQLKADQKAEAARREREALEQASREEDHMRQLAARKKRQERDRSRSNSQSSGSRTSSSDRKSSEHRSRKKHSSSRSKSPNPGDRSPENSGGHSRGGYHTSGSSGSRHYEGISGGDHRDREERSYREGRSYRSYDNNRYDKYSEGYQRSYSRNHSRGSDNHHKDNGDGYRKRDSYRRSDDSKEPSYKVRKLVDY